MDLIVREEVDGVVLDRAFALNELLNRANFEEMGLFFPPIAFLVVGKDQRSNLSDEVFRDVVTDLEAGVLPRLQRVVLDLQHGSGRNAREALFVQEVGSHLSNTRFT